MSTVLKPLTHQQDTIDSLNKQFKDKTKRKQLVILPSGSGKTHTIAFHVAQLKPETFLYVVHQNDILTQTVKIFREICNLNNGQIGIINQKNKDYDKPYLFATIQTLRNDKNLYKIKKNIEYMVIDEYHHVAADSYVKILTEHFNPKYLVGLTATPYRLDKLDIMKHVDGNIANEIDLFEGIEQDILVPFNYVGLWDNIDYSEIRWSGYKYNVGDLDKKLIIHKRDEAVLEEYKKRILPEKRLSIGFCNSVDHVNRITEKFKKAGIKAVGVTYKEKPEIRNEILYNFRNGYYDILFTRDILNEGVDFPECNAVLLLRPTISKTIFFQQIGRGLRKKKGKKDVLILDYIGNYHRAFEKNDWLKMYKKMDEKTGQNIKPYFEYSPKINIHFDPRVIKMMELQERYQGDIVTKELLLKDYLNCCRLENKKQLSSKEYNDSKYRKCSYRSVNTLFGSFYQFVTESGIDYDTNRVGPVGYMACRDKEELTKNYYDVKKKWLAAGGKNRYTMDRPDCPPVTVLNDPKMSKYHSCCYMKTWGKYRIFLQKMGEIVDRPDIIKYDNEEVKALKLKLLVESLQKKLGRQYFTLSDWRKEYKGLAKSDIERMGFNEFRQSMGVPISNVVDCIVCGKEFSTQFASNKYYVCSDRCRNLDGRYRTRPNRDKIKQDKLNNVMIDCEECGKTVHKYYKNDKNSSTVVRQRFCSKPCANKNRRRIWYREHKSKNNKKNKDKKEVIT